MAKVSTGPAPWSHKDFWDWREGFKRITKKTLQDKGVEWSLSSGYRKSNDWERAPKKPQTKRVTLYNGRVVEVPDADFEDFIGHHASPSSDPYSEVGKYIDKAWESNKIEVDGVGHITDIIYAPSYQMMWVGFETDGAVVVFFRVPREVFSELKYLADTKQTAVSPVDGKQRHALGMRFWDIVRIRGQLKGTRYRFEYSIEGDYTHKGTKVSREAESVQKALASTETTKEEQSEADRMDWLNTFARSLTGDVRNKYFALKTFNERYKFLRARGLDIPLDEEDDDTDDYSDLKR